MGSPFHWAHRVQAKVDESQAIPACFVALRHGRIPLITRGIHDPHRSPKNAN
jgi:hypothetical protein